MLKLMREWGFPAVLGTLWGMALVYTLHSVSGLPFGTRREARPATAPAAVSEPMHRS